MTSAEVTPNASFGWGIPPFLCRQDRLGCLALKGTPPFGVGPSHIRESFKNASNIANSGLGNNPHLPVPYVFATRGLYSYLIYWLAWELGSKYTGNWKIRVKSNLPKCIIWIHFQGTLATLDLRQNALHPGIVARLRRTMEEKRALGSRYGISWSPKLHL